MRRLGPLLIVVALGLELAGPANAHPLGNFSINHLVSVRVSSHQAHLHYILDQAEIPTFQEHGLTDDDILGRKRAEVVRGLTVSIDGHGIPLSFLGPATITHPPGQGGLPLTRVEFDLLAEVPDRTALVVSDQTFPDRVGWKAIVAQPGTGTSVHSSAPSDDPTDGLRSYPTDRLSSPLDQRTATLTVGPGDGSLVAPRESGSSQATTTNRSGDGFAGVFSQAAAGKGVLILLLLAAFGWGAVHALSPGHGKAMVAAYLVGSRGTPRHAVALGLTVTVTHTIGVFALGAVTLVLSQYVLPDQLFPWLNLASGLLVLVIGGSVLRSRLRWRRRETVAVTSPEEAARLDAPALTLAHVHVHEHVLAQAHAHDGTDSHEHHHDHDHDHHAHGHHAHGDPHTHTHGGRAHSHAIPDRITTRGLVVMGMSAGLIPCPSALVVLLGAIAQHQVALGLLLILAFSAGLAGTLSGLGLAVVWTRGFAGRVNFTSPLVAALPAASALVIVGVGLLLTFQAIPKL